MKKVIVIVFAIIICACETKRKESFPTLTINEDEWSVFEGRWLATHGVLNFELLLKPGAFGVDSYYILKESFISDSLANGTKSEAMYSSYQGPNQEISISLHDVGPYPEAKYFRFKKEGIDSEIEMFFITRGENELLPCDNKFQPITTDWRYTLHKRSKLFTVEGYITFEQDSANFFERNTREKWRLAKLGEFDDLRSKYSQLVKQKDQGIYLRALAYSISANETPGKTTKDSLVIKSIKSFDKDPDF